MLTLPGTENPALFLFKKEKKKKKTLASLQDVLSSQVQNELSISHRRPQLRKISEAVSKSENTFMLSYFIFFQRKNNHCLSCFVDKEGKVERSSRLVIEAALLPLPPSA